MTDQLRKFMSAACDIDADLDRTANALRKNPPPEFAGWLRTDLGAAISAGDFTPEVAEGLTSIGFDSQAEVDGWLHEVWSTWFPEVPYPA